MRAILPSSRHLFKRAGSPGCPVAHLVVEPRKCVILNSRPHNALRRSGVKWLGRFLTPTDALMIDEILESASGDLDEARDRIVATREAQEGLLDAGGDLDQVRAAIARLEGIEAELAAVERRVAGRVGVKG